MRLSTLSTILFPLTVLGSSAQVNFYYDDNCQDYAGYNIAELGRQAVGGPYGARSMLFATIDASCSHTCGPNLLFCKNEACQDRASYDKQSYANQCMHYENGVWARIVCGCLS